MSVDRARGNKNRASLVEQTFIGEAKRMMLFISIS